MIMENALKMAVVGPAKVIILSGQLPSEMLMRAPLCRQREKLGIKRFNFEDFEDKLEITVPLTYSVLA